jgi:hypothetical protein
VKRFTGGDNTPVPHERVETDAKGDSVGYLLDEQQEHYLTFRDAIINYVKAPLRRFSRAPLNKGFWRYERCVV